MSTPQYEPDQAAAIARCERRLALLEELAEIGMEIARTLRPGAQLDERGAAPASDEAQAPGRDPAEAFAKVSRAVRLTIALQAKLESDFRRPAAPGRAGPHGREEHAAAPDSAHAGRLLAVVSDAIWREDESDETKDRLLATLNERLDWALAFVESPGKPIRDIVERVCHDLGLSPDWSLWAGDGFWEGPLETGPVASQSPAASPADLE